VYRRTRPPHTAHGTCEDLKIDETIWGPVVGRDLDGRPVAWAWTAHDPGAVRLDGLLALESAKNVRQALDDAHQVGLPQQNLVLGDRDGHIAWTVIGQVPRRVGLNDQLPHSWADGAYGWNGYLSAAEIPEIIDPPSGLLWTANNRVVGGDALVKLGDGGYADGVRASRIRDRLVARDRFVESNLLAIQTDDRAAALDPWQRLMLDAIAANRRDKTVADMRPYVTAWGGRAEPGSVGYRLVREFRQSALTLVFDKLIGPVSARLGGNALPLVQWWPIEQLLVQRPALLVPEPFKTWDDVLGAALDPVARSVDNTQGGLAAYEWGAVNRTGIHHPFTHSVPLLGYLTDPPDVPLAGDNMVPRVAVPGFGASERLVVSPGHEALGLLEMPVGQSDNPLSPYYGAGQDAWVKGSPAPLLPGAPRWTLELMP